jgi:hypothetical protein
MIQVRPDLTKARAMQFGSTPATQLHHVNQDINRKRRGRYAHVCLHIVYISRGRETVGSDKVSANYMSWEERKAPSVYYFIRASGAAVQGEIFTMCKILPRPPRPPSSASHFSSLVVWMLSSR